MEPSKEAIAVRISRLNRQILGKVTAGSSKFSKKTIDREALLDALTVLYDECNDDPVKKSDELVRTFVDKYRSTLAELRRIRVCMSDFEILHTIGRGQFGDVHMVREKETCDVYALKCMRKEEARKRAAAAACDEREVLASAAGPWVPKLQYAFQDNSSLYLVMELCPGGDLAGLLSRRHNPLSERDAAFYVAEVAHALKGLHQLGFVHRDLKPHNILLDRCGHIKLGDFGSCARLSDGGGGAVLVAAAGTPDYVAPELLAAADCARRHAVCAQCCQGIVHTALSACDYWSLGVVAFELVTLRRPFSSGDDDSIATILSNIQKYERSPEAEPPFESAPNGPSDSWRALVAGLLRVTPSRRFNYLDTLQHASLAHLSVHSIRDQVRHERSPEAEPPFESAPNGPSDSWRALVAGLLRVTPSRRFNYLDTLQHASLAHLSVHSIRDQVRHERSPEAEPPFESAPNGPSDSWRALVAGLLRVTPSRRFNYLDTLQHASLAHLSVHSIRDQVRHERSPEAEPPFESAPNGPSDSWRALVAGLLRVTPSRRFNYLDTLQHASLAHLSVHSIRDQVRHERSPEAEPPFESAPNGPSDSWRALVAGLLRVTPSRRFNYLDTLQHASLAHLSVHSIRDQVRHERSPEAEPPFESAPNGPSDSWRALVAGLLRVTPSRRFNYLDTLQHASLAHLSVHSIRDQVRHERSPEAEPPFESAPNGPSDSWRALVAGLLRVTPSRRFNYLDTLQHASLAHLSVHSIRDQVRHERSPEAEPPFESAPNGPSDSWRALVAGLLRVTPSRRFNYLDTLQHASLAHLSVHSIRDQVRHERSPEAEPPFESAPNGPSDSWRALVAGLLRVTPSRRFNYLDTLQHASLAHLSVHSIRDQVRHERSPEAEPPFESAPNGPSDSWRALVAGLLRVTPSRRFNYLDTLQHASLAHLSVHSIRDQVRHERSPEAEPPFESAPNGPSDSWRALVAGLLRVTPSRRFNYLDTLQHASLAHLSVHSIRDQVRHERSPEAEPPFESAPNGPSDSWRALVAGLLRVTPSRRFNYLDTLQHASLAHLSVHSIRDQVRHERSPEAEPPFESAPNGPSDSWRALVAGLLRVTPSRRFNYLDTLQHASLAHLSVHSIRDQAPPWVPCVRGPEDAAHFSPPPREAPPVSAAPFRARPPFAGQLPFIGYSYVAPDDNDDSAGSTGFNATHDCTAIDLATFKSSEKLAAMRGREIASLQNKLAAAEAAANAAAERARRAADADAERTRARLQADITALSLQNKRLERQIEIEKEERMALERTNQELISAASERNSTELRVAQAQNEELASERDGLRQDMARLEARVSEMQNECAKAAAAADAARAQHKHYKDSIAKERALRRQTLSGGEAETREAGARAAAAEAAAARETRARELAERRLADVEADARELRKELGDGRRELATLQEALGEKQRVAAVSTEQLKEAQLQLTQERVRASTLAAQVQELQRTIQESCAREAALEEQCARTEARFNERLDAAETRAAAALHDDARHREKVNTLEQLVRQLEREVTALETRTCAHCEAAAGGSPHKAHSDTESVGDAAHAQAHVLQQQLQRAEGQLQARADEIAALRQEARSANLARWRKEREFNELSTEAKATARDLKRAEERLSAVLEAKRTAERKATELQTELEALKPQHEQATKEAERAKQQLAALQKRHETAQAEVDRSRNDIRKLKSELQYSEKRRMHAEEQEEMSSRERAQLRDENVELRAHNNELLQNNKALQDACSLLEEQLIDLEKLADMNEVKNKDLECEVQRLRADLSAVQQKLGGAQSACAERSAAAALAAQSLSQARDQAKQTAQQMQLLQERVDRGAARISSLESRCAQLEEERLAAQAALENAARRVRELQEECAALRTRAHEHHELALRLRAGLDEAQEQVESAREAAEAATAWWRTRETKADATLRQQAKLIDFLQAKVEESGRKKCSLGNKLFGRSGRRPNTSPPLRRANRELREEVDRLRAKLAASKSFNEGSYPPTPRREKKIPNGTAMSIDTPDARTDTTQDPFLLIVWSDGSRERMSAHVVDGALVLRGGGRELRARRAAADADAAAGLPFNEASRAFAIKIENPDARGDTASAVCGSRSARTHWLGCLSAPAPAPPAPVSAGYTPQPLKVTAAQPLVALYVADNAIAIGCSDGLQSLRGSVRLSECGLAPVTCGAVCGARALLGGAALLHGGALPLSAALRQAGALQPVYSVERVPLPDNTQPHLIKAMVGGGAATSCAVGLGRRVALLRWDAAAAGYSCARALTVDRAPPALLLTPAALYIAGERPLRVALPAGPLETFAPDEPTVAAAARKRSAPKAILLVDPDPVEILLCYAECGVFVDAAGRRTRHEDPKWSSSVHEFEYVRPFLYAVGEDRVTIVHVNEEAYRAPACTCDSGSVASSGSEFCMPEIFNLKLSEPKLLGTTPEGIIVSTRCDDGYQVSAVNGLAAFRSVGTSLESLNTVSEKGSTPDLGRSLSNLGRSLPDLNRSSPQYTSQETLNGASGFLADIKKRARQLRAKNRKQNQMDPDDVIKEILTTEIGLKRGPSGRKSPALTSEFDSDSDSRSEQDAESDGPQRPEDVCAEMFTRQVRFQ